VLELGCGLGVPSVVAARAGASVLATDADPDALDLLRRNAALNDAELETARVDWTAPANLLDRAPFDLVLAADVMYERESVAPLLELLPRLAPEAWIADPGRAHASTFLARAAGEWRITTATCGVVRIHKLRT
jgi:predicted nicotinamide N-methyase